jgi:3-hydroxybutyryl-CoA dehydrogenase
MAEIKTLAVIGAGSLGRSIAYAAALAGYRTIVEDILPASLRRAENEVRDHLAQAIAQGRLTEAKAAAALACLQYAGSVEEAARQADLVIEAVPDEMESKLEIFTLLDKISKPHTILACTTATLNVTEIASITYRPGKILGLCFSNLADEMGHLEIVRAAETDDETIAACAEIGRRMSKEVVVREEDKSGG